MSHAPLAAVLRQVHELAAARRPDGEIDGDLLRRFVAAQDRHAFETLVRRHGPLVLGVCRRVLRQEQDAEDAFQATFLILARKAASVCDAAAVVSWLHGVAERTARAAKRTADRRHAYETRARVAPPSDPSTEAAWREVQAALDDEIGRLPDRLRSPFLLCHLEGQSRAEAARQLGLAEGTVWNRLARARKLLRGRLARRGITPTAVPCLVGIARSAGTEPLPPGLSSSTTRAAAALAQGRAGGVSATVDALVEGGVRTVASARSRAVLGLAITASLLAAGAAVLTLPTPTPDSVAKEDPQAGPAAEKAVAAKDVAGRTTDLYGDPLPPGALVRMGTVRFRHKGTGQCVAFTPDGKQIVTAANDGTVRFWASADGKELRSISVEHGVPALGISADGKILATAEGDAIRLWDPPGRALRSIAGEKDVPFQGTLVFSPDGATLAAAAKDGSVRLYQTATGKKQQALPAGAKTVRCVAFTADGKSLVTVGDDASEPLRVWDLTSGRLTRELPIKSPPGDLRIRPLALALDGRTLAVECATEQRVKNPGGGITVSTRYRLCLRDVSDGRERLRTEGEDDVLWAAAFSADGISMATAGMGNHVRVWDAASGQLRVALESHPSGSRPDAPGTLAFSPDGKRVASVGESGVVHVWDMTARAEVAGLPEGHQAAVRAVAYAPDGQTLASAADDHTIRLWDAVTGHARRLLSGHTAGVNTLAYGPDGRTLASADAGGILRLWDPATGKELRKIQAVPADAGFYSGLCPLAFTPDGKHLASWGDDRCFRLWELATGKEVASHGLVLSGVPALPAGRPKNAPPTEAYPGDVRFAADGRTAAVAVAGSVYLVDVVTGQELFKLPGFVGPYYLALSPDGRTLASGGWDKKVRVWDVIAGQELLQAEGLDYVSAVAVAPDGRTVAAGMGWTNGEVRLLDVRTGETLLRLRGHSSYVAALAFSPDGKTLASGQRDTTALVWDLSPGLQRLGAVAREMSQEELRTRWAHLAGADARKARVAVEALTAAPRVALPFLKARVRPVGRAQPEQIQRLITDLDSGEFTTRDAATKALATLGAEAEPALRQVLRGNPSAETKRRVEALLQGPPPRAIPSGELLRQLRAIEVLERIGSPEAASFVRELAAGAPSARQTLEAQAAHQRLSHWVAKP
jgi:RNA polymerase sigma factor (sigma-70 family)